MPRVVLDPSARIFLAGRENDPSAKKILALVSCKLLLLG